MPDTTTEELAALQRAGDRAVERLCRAVEREPSRLRRLFLRARAALEAPTP